MTELFDFTPASIIVLIQDFNLDLLTGISHFLQKIFSLFTYFIVIYKILFLKRKRFYKLSQLRAYNKNKNRS